MKHDFTKTMKNVYVSDEGSTPRSRGRENWSVAVDIKAEDKVRFQTFMKEELKFYNNLLEAFNPRVRSNPKSVSAMTDQWQKIFGQLAISRVSALQLLKATEEQTLPENLEPFRKTLLGSDADGNRILTPDMATALEVAASSGNIHTTVRRNMASEILRFYKEQSVLFNESTNGGRMDDVFIRAPQTLEELDIQKKRHLQVPRNICRIVYDKASDTSGIFHPYSKSPLIVRNQDLTKDATWSLMIIHQEPGSVPRADTRWVLDFKTTSDQYLIKYVDVMNPGRNSAFREGKKRAY